MPRRVVWYPAGSPVASLLSALPGDLEATPLPARGVPRSGPDEGAVALVDLTAGDARAASELASPRPISRWWPWSRRGPRRPPAVTPT